ISWELILRPRSPAVTIDRANARLAQSLDGCIRVLWTIADVRPVQKRCHTRVDSAKRADEIPNADVFGPIDGSRRSCDVARVVAQQTIGKNVAQRSFPHVPMRIDKTWYDDHAGGIDGRRGGGDVRSHFGDPASLDQAIGFHECAAPGIERTNTPTLEQ